jgi:ABC-type multidrug transport system ATPase subunit
MIEAVRLGVYSREATLWDGVDLAFDAGSVWVVTGPASSGKTVLLSILRGERQPDAGDVVVSGESLYRGSAEAARSFRASSGHVPERFADAPGRTVEDLLRLSALAGGGMKPGEFLERQVHLLSMVGLYGAEKWRLSSLSTSERVRAALAAELLRGPRFLFGDGVVAASGRAHWYMLGGLFRALSREGNTIILAERGLPERWEGAAGEGKAVGPFRIYCLPLTAPSDPAGRSNRPSVTDATGGQGVQG